MTDKPIMDIKIPDNPTKLPRYVSASIWMLLCCFSLSMIAGLGRYAAIEGIHPLQTVFIRLLFGLLTILPIIIYCRMNIFRTRQMKMHIIRSCVGICTMWLWFYAIALIPITDQTALSFLAPIFTTLGAVFFLREIVKLRRLIAIIIGFLGAMIILRPGFIDLNTGHYLAAFTALSMGMTFLLIKHLTAKDSPLMIVFLAHLFMTPLSLIPALAVWSWFPADLWLYLLAFGPFAILGHFSLAKAYSLVDASFVAALDYARLPFAALIGWLMFAETSDIWTWVGASFIFGSALYIVRREMQLARAKTNMSKTGEGEITDG